MTWSGMVVLPEHDGTRSDWERGFDEEPGVIFVKNVTVRSNLLLCSLLSSQAFSSKLLVAFFVTSFHRDVLTFESPFHSWNNWNE